MSIQMKRPVVLLYGGTDQTELFGLSLDLFQTSSWFLD